MEYRSVSVAVRYNKSMRIRKIHLPSFGVQAITFAAALWFISWALSWPLGLIILSELTLVIGVTWILTYDFLPYFFPFLRSLEKHYRKKDSFLFILLIVSLVAEGVSYFLPSGDTKGAFNTVSFYSFIGAILWFVGATTYQWVIPSITFLRPRQPTNPVADEITTADVITAMAAVSVPPVIVLFLLAPAGLVNYQFTPGDFFILSLVLELTIIIYIYNWLIRPKITTWRGLGLRTIKREKSANAFLLFLLVSVGIAIVETIARRIGISITQYAFTSRNSWYLAFISGVIIAPIVEELFFRGFLFQALKPHSSWAAYLVSAGFFALLHPPVALMVEGLLIGLFLAYLVAKTKSIWPGVVIHAINNAIALGFLLLK